MIAPRRRANAVSCCIRPGDITIKYSDGSVSNLLIRFGQLFGRGPSQFVHAGIASSATTVIELSGSGLHENNLFTDNAQLRYEVFRCRQPEVPLGAAETAKMMLVGVREYAATGTGMNLP